MTGGFASSKRQRIPIRSRWQEPIRFDCLLARRIHLTVYPREGPVKFKMTILAALMASTSLSVANAADLRMSWWGGNSRHEATQKTLTYCGDKLGHTIAPEFTS